MAEAFSAPHICTHTAHAQTLHSCTPHAQHIFTPFKTHNILPFTPNTHFTFIQTHSQPRLISHKGIDTLRHFHTTHTEKCHSV